MSNSRTLLLKKFIHEPQLIGSITPSSVYLKNKMLTDLPWEDMTSIIELGAGTGVFTEYIAAHKREDCKAIIVEQDETMRHRLADTYQDLIFAGRAEKLKKIVNSCKLTQVDCIISGLPFATFNEQIRKQIINDIHAVLKPDGIFVAFQYSPQLRNFLHHKFRQVRCSFELFNLPPAFIYFCQK